MKDWISICISIIAVIISVWGIIYQERKSTFRTKEKLLLDFYNQASEKLVEILNLIYKIQFLYDHVITMQYLDFNIRREKTHELVELVHECSFRIREFIILLNKIDEYGGMHCDKNDNFFIESENYMNEMYYQSNECRKKAECKIEPISSDTVENITNKFSNSIIKKCDEIMTEIRIMNNK